MRDTTSFLLEDALASRHDRDVYFQKGLDYLGQNSIRGILGDQRYRFHWNINLYIETLAHCNGSCAFCINRVNYDHKDIPDSRFIRNLEESIKLVRFLDPSIQLVGGEPTIVPNRLRAIFELIGKYGLRKPVITSNGSGLVKDPALVDDIEPLLAHLNISRHHDDDRTLNTIMGFENPLDNAMLAGLLQTYPIASKIRLNCCLLGDGIQSYADIERYLIWALNLGVKNVCFSTLSKLPDDYYYEAGLVEQSKENTVEFAAIMNAVSADSRFKFIKFHTGSHCMYEVWQYGRDGRSCVVVFATSNNYFARKLDGIDDLVELLVFHADGVLAGSWNRNCKIIYGENQG
jgi:MoaA/NifB/PqqE/SkfB family radical SAM enzyme